jgi:hypothetical protein
MPNSIEIFENTLLQLITRQGTDNDRTEVILKSGELGYTTDTKRLFVGDGSTSGGNVVGNKFRGYTADLTTLGSGLIGDIAYKTDENSIYSILSGDGTNPANWQKIGGVYTAADGSIQRIKFISWYNFPRFDGTIYNFKFYRKINIIINNSYKLYYNSKK